MRLPRAIRRLLHRQLMLGAAVVCLLGQASAFAHLALVRHTTCPQHEDALVHAGAAHPGASTATTRIEQVVAGQRLTAPPAGAADGHEDDHCLMAAFRRSDLTAPDQDAGQMLAAGAGPRPVPAQAPDSRPFPVPLLLLAPKSSPPLALG